MSVLEQVDKLRDHVESKTNLENLLADLSNHYHKKDYVEVTVNTDHSSSSIYLKNYDGKGMHIKKAVLIDFTNAAIKDHQNSIDALIKELGGNTNE